ncbi:acyl carrier protein [Kitasatospora sp. Ki12]|uniref:acyl carrier protein n=1 Tax=Kitasatospora xanthocidica TaxID=83382 RepID=UPI001992FD01|nr:acyl carrier protein [Kitasatospora xanthocidica]GHF89565.1 actinorhodin polyketide synthase acyl carrier protein [Kitasatospora xanthocidica]
MSAFTIEDLKRIMRDCAGEEESVDLDGDILDLRFEELGYDSLALIETTSRISREFAVQLPEDELGEIGTVRDLLALINQRLSVSS